MLVGIMDFLCVDREAVGSERSAKSIFEQFGREVSRRRRMSFEQQGQRLVAGESDVIGISSVDASALLRDRLQLLVHSKADHVGDHRTAGSALRQNTLVATDP